jgi:uncharacterized membrane protein
MTHWRCHCSLFNSFLLSQPVSGLLFFSLLLLQHRNSFLQRHFGYRFLLFLLLELLFVLGGIVI